MTIVEFLEARLAEDERIAKATGEDATYGFTWPNTQYEVRSSELIHIRRHDPARALAEVAAKRAIIAASKDTYGGPPWEDADIDSGEADAWDGRQTAYREVLANLAAVYSSHPDYQQEWVPNP